MSVDSESVEAFFAVVEIGASLASVPCSDNWVHSTPRAFNASVPVANYLEFTELPSPVGLLWKLDFSKVRLTDRPIDAYEQLRQSKQRPKSIEILR